MSELFRTFADVPKFLGRREVVGVTQTRSKISFSLALVFLPHLAAKSGLRALCNRARLFASLFQRSTQLVSLNKYSSV